MISALPSALPERQLSELQHFAETLAAEAGELAANGYGSANARRKFDGSLVTELDEASDRLLSKRIAAAFPNHAVLSEEQITRYDPANEFTWVLDPIDGTTNFARGLPLWGVSVGLLRYGLPIVSSVVFPLLHEFFAASAGQGATRNGVAIHASTRQSPQSEYLLGTCTRTEQSYDIKTSLKVRNLGSAAYHIVKVADGSLLGDIEATPKIWDLAGAGLILQEAGGMLRQIDGHLVFPIEAVPQDYKSVSFPVIAASNELLWTHIHESLTER